MFLWSRSEFWFVFSWNTSVKSLPVKTPSCTIPSMGTSSVNNTLLFLLDTFVVPSSEKMLYKSSLFLLEELVEARVVSGSAAKRKDFLESIVSSFLTFGAFAQKSFDFVKIPMTLVPPIGWETFTPMMCFEVTSTLWAFFFPSKEFLVHNFQKNASQSP